MAVLSLTLFQEQYDYIRELLEYLVVGIDRGILIGKGTIFVLYAYFVIQPPNPWQRINIPITNEELKNFKALVQAYCDNQVGKLFQEIN